TCTCDKGSCTLGVVLDRQGRMSGFWLPSIRPNAKYTPPDYVDRKAFREEKVTVDAGSFPLPGTISIPNGDGPHPGVVLVHGSGAHDQDESIIGNKPFRDLAWGLASRGVAVLRYEKRTHKYHPADMKPEEITFEWETIDDAVAAAALLREHAAIDRNRVFVAGHSLGAMASPFIAKKEPKLAGLILLAGAARSLLDLIVEQTAYIAASDGNLSDEERKQIDLIQQAVADIKAGNVKEGGNAAGLPGPYLARMDKLDPVGAARKLSIPMLIMQGARDYQVTTTDFELWQRGLKDRKNVTFKLYDDLNHLFMTGSGKSTPAEYQQVGHVDAQVVRDIAEWIAATAQDD
ncbi:MAG: alpha/beta fold hydrolase, partial [Planctomycetes bacterium]|nr:alpha/beta fold hydrolase [Planctomycetota bacterium]